MQDVIDCWDKKASQWAKWVGKNGDNNRRFNSDPVLWKFAGDVVEKNVLDAGCGTGYLSVLLAEKSAIVTGIDVSQKMIQESINSVADKKLDITFNVDSASELRTIKDESMDLIISNYVLMDLPDLDGAVKNFYRVLRPGGKAVCVIGHPCNGDLPEDKNYFDENKITDRWGPFDSDFIYFNRPISQYWKSFKSAGFKIDDFDEPVAQNTDVPGFKEEWKESYRKQPWSLAFLLQK